MSARWPAPQAAWPPARACVAWGGEETASTHPLGKVRDRLWTCASMWDGTVPQLYRRLLGRRYCLPHRGNDVRSLCGLEERELLRGLPSLLPSTRDGRDEEPFCWVLEAASGGRRVAGFSPVLRRRDWRPPKRGRP